MLFTLYSAYVYRRGGETWVGTLIRLMACFGISEQAVRSEFMRMTRRRHLRVRRVGNYNFYSLTPEGQKTLGQGARRIFFRPRGPWGGWSSAVLWNSASNTYDSNLLVDPGLVPELHPSG